MTKMIGRVNQGWCPVCKAKPGPDCPDTAKDKKAVKQNEKRGWQKRELGFLGSLKAAPKDLSTNPKYMEGFGE